MGRGLQSVEQKSEHMLLQLKTSEHISTRRAAILKVEMDNQTHLSKIESYLKIKYSIGEAQKQTLYNEIKKKKLHESCIGREPTRL